MIVCRDESLDLGAKRELLICKNLLQSSMADESCWATTTLRCFQWFCLHCLIQHKHTGLVQSKLRFPSLNLNTFSYTQNYPSLYAKRIFLYLKTKWITKSRLFVNLQLIVLITFQATATKLENRYIKMWDVSCACRLGSTK